MTRLQDWLSLSASVTLLGVIVIICAIFDISELIGYVFFVVAFVTILFLTETSRELRVVTLCGFGLRFGAVLFHNFVGELPDSQSDARRFMSIAMNWAQLDWGTLWSRLQPDSYVYTWIISAIFKLVGASTLVAQAINVFLGSLTIIVIYRTGRILWGPHHAIWHAGLVAVMPTLILYSALPLREAAIALLLSIGALNFIRWVNSRSPTHYLGCATALSLASILHMAILAALVALFLTTLIQFVRSARRRVATNLPEFAISMSFILALFSTGWGTTKIPDGFGTALETIADSQAYSVANARTTFLAGAPINNPLDLIVQAPARIVLFLFSPFPWQVRSLGDLTGLLDSIIILVLTVRIWHWIYIRRHRGAVSLSILAIAVTMVFAVSVHNYGTAIRHRAKILPLLVTLAGPSMNRQPGRNSPRQLLEIPGQRTEEEATVHRFHRL